MATGWIKMRTNLATDPAVAIIARQTKASVHAVVGKLHAVWSWADAHTDDGFIAGVDAGWIDKYVAKRGFAKAMADAGWLSITDDGIEFPGYTEHNGDTAKTRAKDQRRKRVSREPKKQKSGSRVIPAAVKRAADERDGPWCRYCGHDTRLKPVGNAADRRKHYDHIIPVCQGGDNTAENVVVACAVCNMKKNGRTPQDAGMSLLCPDSVHENADSSWTRGEERREEENHPPLPPSGGSRGSDGNPCPKVGETEQKAALAAINAWSQHDRQTPLLTPHNEHRRFWTLLGEIADMPPVPTPKGAIPASAMVPKAIAAKRSDKTPFKSVAFAMGCVRSQITEWSIAGVGDGETATETASERRLRLAREAEGVPA